jgi:hypothetical protein
MRVNSNITLYNKWIDATTRSEKYQRTQVLGVFWQGSKGATVLSKGGYIELDKATIYIPWKCGANYLKPIAWQALVSKSGFWTLQQGDFVCRGLIADEITDAYTDPITHVVTPAFTMTDLAAKYDDVFTLSNIGTMDQGSPNLWHFQIGAG